ncbi:MAG TPA: hypothetical protein VN837_11750, partial [Chloroflexota bacterium]|nr:hypothetical protein [Chloroflexota bacterium]
VSRPASAATRRSRACYPDGDPSPSQAGLETRAPKWTTPAAAEPSMPGDPRSYRAYAITRAAHPV